MGGQTLEERVAVLESNALELKKVYEENNKLQKDLIREMQLQSQSMIRLSESVNEMSPIVKDVIQAKFYGSVTFKVFTWIGGVTLAIITIWPHIRKFIHFLLS